MRPNRLPASPAYLVTEQQTLAPGGTAGTIGATIPWWGGRRHENRTVRGCPGVDAGRGRAAAPHFRRRERRLRQLLAAPALRGRYAHRHRHGRHADQPHRAGHRRRSHLPTPPGGAGPAGPDRPGGRRGTPHPGHRGFPPLHRRGLAGPSLRPSGPAHRGISLRPAPPAAGEGWTSRDGSSGSRPSCRYRMPTW